MSDRVNDTTRTASKIHDALSAADLEYSAMSWNGFNLFGDRASIDEAKRMQHAAGTVPALKDRIKEVSDALQQKSPDSNWQPIDTAPKMKTILMWAATDIGDDGKIKNWKMATGHYSEGHHAWIWDGMAVRSYEVQPTHWKTLPAAPVETSGKPTAGGG